MAAPLSIFGRTTGLPATTRSGIPYEIDALAYRETWVPGANKTVVVCRVPWVQSFDWITDMVGEVDTASVSGTTRVRRELPEKNPYDQNQYCTKVEQIDMGELPTAGSLVDEGKVTFAHPTHGWPVVRWVRYRCTFEGMPFAMATDAEVDGSGLERELLRYVVRSRKPVPREQQIPGGGFETLAGDKLMNTAFKTIIFEDVTYTWVRVPVAGFQANADKDGLLGKINSVAFDVRDTMFSPGGYNWSEKKLLYLGYDDTNKYFDANDDWVCDVVFNFRAKSIGWHKFLDKNGDPVEVRTVGGAAPPYASDDFHKLFRVG